MKPSFNERLCYTLARLAKVLENYQHRRVDRAKAKMEKLKAGALDIALIGADAFTDYRLLKRDRLYQVIDRAEGERDDQLKHAAHLRRQANSLENSAHIAYEQVNHDTTQAIDAIYKEKL